MDRSLQGATRSLGPAMLSLALAAAASAQTLLTASGQPGDFNLGVAVSRVGDVNGDGHDDFIAGATQHIPNLSTEPGTGVARIYSGKDGAVLFTFHGDAAGDQFGQTVSWAGDANLDGVPDVVVGAEFVDDASGIVRLYSGKNGKVLHAWDGGDDDHFGRSVSGAADIDGDGHADVVVGAPRGSSNDGAGEALVFSGADGDELLVLAGAAPGDRFGHAVAGGFDANADGVGDLVVGATRSDVFGKESGSIWVYSGKQGSLLYVFHGETKFHRYGWRVAGAGDLDGDGHGDFLTGTRWNSPSYPEGMARAYSGKTGQVLHTVFSEQNHSHFGEAVSAAGDVDQDGFGDFLVGAPGLGGSTVLLFASLGLAELPLGGGCSLYLAPFPSPLLFAGSLAGSGPGQGTLALAAAVPSGFAGTVTLQAFLQDPGATLGWTSTRAIQVTVP